MKGAIATLLFFLLFFSFLESIQFEKSNLNYAFSIEAIKIYDFSINASVDRWAYRKDVSERPPQYGAPSKEFINRQYQKIAYDDGIYQSDTARKNRYAAHRFVFTIHENRSRIKNVRIFWKGAGFLSAFGLPIPYGSGFTLYAWNYSSSSYDEIFSTNSYDVFNVSKNVSLDYVNGSGEITLLAEQNSVTTRIFFITIYSVIETDYVCVEVKYV